MLNSSDASETAAPTPLWRSEAARYLALGVALAPVFTFTPWLRAAAWILVSIIHELGHTAFAWFVGCPAVPVLNVLTHGEAATIHLQQLPWGPWVIWAGLIYLVWCAWRMPGRPWVIHAALIAALYPAVAFHEHWRELAHVMAGHLGELLFAAICLWRARTGLFVHHSPERAAYACVGWYFIFNAIWLELGLAFFPSVRQWYENARSYGIANDYERAGWMTSSSMERVAIVMFVLTLLIIPATLMSKRWLKI